MGVREQALARLAERQAQERSMVRGLTRRLDAAQAATEAARRALDEAVAARAAVLVEWAGQPGWTAEAIADHTGLPLAEVRAAVGRRRRGHGGGRPPQRAGTADRAPR
jgi:hypothetical protein